MAYNVSVDPANCRVGFKLGQTISTWLTAVGIPSCSACQQRAVALDQLGDWFNGSVAQANPCKTFAGRCTGLGRRQCITAPASITADATTVTQCCGGWFQYPWITVCPGQAPQQGCGFCLF